MEFVIKYLDQEYKCYIDDEDSWLLSKYKWFICKTRAKTFYLSTTVKINNKLTSFKLHRLITKAQKGNIVDHIDGNGLNNQKINLRFVTQSQNSMNRKPRGNKKYKGVHFCNTKKKWVAEIEKDDNQYRIGYFNSELEAIKAYNQKAKELFGEFAWLNPID